MRGAVLKPIRVILVPTDFSDCSRRAFSYACELSGKFDAKLLLLHVIEPPSVSLMPDGAYVPPAYDEIEDSRAVRDELNRWLVGPPADQCNAGFDIRIGTPVLEILSYAKQRAADLIVLGTHGRTGIAHLLIGSVAENVVRKSECPVLTVPERMSEE